MPLLTAKNIHVSFGPDVIFDGLDLKIYPGTKVGLIGPNGCGKTTLLNILFGSLVPDIGSIQKVKNLEIGYLPQQQCFDGDKTVFEELHAEAGDILKLQEKIHSAADSISRLTGSELKAAMRRYDKLTVQFELSGGYEYEIRIKEVASGLGLDEKYLNVKTCELSGGQLSRLGLAKVLLKKTNLLLLDEPTNHLDWDATGWLEKFLKNYKHAAIIVSHDRFLLDKLASGIVEVSNSRAVVFSGNYTAYREQKRKKQIEFDRQYRQRLDFVAKTRDFIDRNRNFKGMQKVARGRQKHLDKILKNDPDFLRKPTKEKSLSFNLITEKKSLRTDLVVSCKKLTKSFGQLTLFNDLYLELYCGERLGIIGPNGSGKTTLLKLLLGQISPSSGTVTIKKNLSIGYLDQATTELNPQNTVLDEAAAAGLNLTPETLRSKLGSVLFTADEVFKKVSSLSGGEKSRLALCKLFMSAPKMIVLDEPTNHLDIPSTEALEAAFEKYSGTIIVVSHDRFFLDRIIDRLLIIGVDKLGKKTPGCHEFVDGSFSQYTELLERRFEQIDRDARNRSTKKTKTSRRGKATKVTPVELKQFNAWAAEKIETALEETEEQLNALRERFGEESVYKNHSLLKELQKEFDRKMQYMELLYRAYERKIG